MKNKIYNYLVENKIDISNDKYIRWIYNDNIKLKYMVTADGNVISIRKYGSKKLRPYIDKDG